MQIRRFADYVQHCLEPTVGQVSQERHAHRGARRGGEPGPQDPLVAAELQRTVVDDFAHKVDVDTGTVGDFLERGDVLAQVRLRLAECVDTEVAM